MSGGLAKGIAVVAVTCAATLGVYEWTITKSSRARISALDDQLQKSQADLSDCTKGRDVDREAHEKTASETAATLDASRAELDTLRADRAETEKRLAAFKSMTDKFRKMIDSGRLQVVLRHGRMVVKLPAGILFASGSADLSKEGQAAIAEVATILKQFPDRHFMVAGHTDNVPIVPPAAFKSNLELSTARALTVSRQLIGAGMAASRLVAAGYGEYEPARPNTSEAARQENRRIEIVLLPNLAELPPMPGDTPADAGAPAPSAAPAHSVAR